MEIPAPQSNNKDIYSYGFDQNLNVPIPNVSTATVYNSLDDATNAAQMLTGGDLTVKSLTISGLSKMVSPGDDLQRALNDVNSAGGGTILFKPGTYTINNSLTGYSGIKLIGTAASTCILNFQGATNLSFTGTKVYTAGTITSIAFGVNVTGNGTSWTSAMIGQQIFINNRWYVIANVTGATTLTLASGYADGATFSGTYRIATVMRDIEISNLTLQNSTVTALSCTDIRDLNLNEVTFLSNNKGYSLTNLMNIAVARVVVASSTSNGYELTNGSFYNALYHASVSNGGSGSVLNTIKSSTFIYSACDSNTSDGFNCTSITNTAFEVECASNGGQGIEFVSGCNNNFITNTLITANTSDGIKLTASSSNNTIGSSINIVSNGGYGINIVDSTSASNTLNAPFYNANTSGNYLDNGANTIIISRVSARGAFGGNGGDGDLTIASGTTTLDLGGNDIVIKNYNSISITGTGKLAFSNPHAGGTLIYLKCAGNLTLTSSTTPNIDASGMGATTTTTPNFFIGSATVYGSAMTGGSIWDSLTKYSTYQTDNYNFVAKVFAIAPGASGAAGGAGTGSGGTAGTAGRGGGALYIECGGSLNFTSTLGINISGTNGGNGGTGNAGGENTGGGGGAGGACGQMILLYNSLIANTGTVNASGGKGGDGGDTNNNSWTGTRAGGDGGGGAASMESAGATGAAHNSGGAPSNGGNGGTGAGAGGGAGVSWDNGAGTKRGPSTGGTAGASSSKHYKILLNQYYS